MRISLTRILAVAMMFAAGVIGAQDAAAQRAVIPGTGSEIVGVADDFEDPNWGYTKRDPKSTEDIDENQRGPMGRSTNGRWYEGIKRGHPDVVERVVTPSGGLPGSQGALLLRSKFTGIPGRPSGTSSRFANSAISPAPLPMSSVSIWLAMISIATPNNAVIP